MNRERKTRRCLLILFAVALLMPVYNTVLFGQNFHMSIFEHATLGSFLTIFWIVFIILMLYIIEFQKRLINIADYVFIVAGLLLIGIVILGQSANPFTYKYGFIAQILVIVAYILLKFIQEPFFKIVDQAKDLFSKFTDILAKTELSEKEVEEEPQQEEPQQEEPQQEEPQQEEVVEEEKAPE